jgi:hypothetical protein
VSLSDEKAKNRFLSSINMPDSSVVGAFKPSKAKRREKTNFVPNLPIHFISNVNLSFSKEVNFSNFIKFCEDKLSL